MYCVNRHKINKSDHDERLCDEVFTQNRSTGMSNWHKPPLLFRLHIHSDLAESDQNIPCLNNTFLF